MSGIEAALLDLIAQGSCCITQPHGQRRIAVKRMTSPVNAICVVSGCRVRTHDLIAQGSCCITQPHGQRRIAVKRTTSPYVQNLVVLATKGGNGEGSREEGGGGGDGEGSGEERRGEGGTVESINLSIIHYMEGGDGGIRH